MAGALAVSIIGVVAGVVSVTGDAEVVVVSRSDANPNASTSGVVKGVINGSTLELTNGKEVRLLQIDSPTPGSECYGDQSKRELNRLASEGATVYIIVDDQLDPKSESGVLWGYAVIEGLFVNVELAKRGAAAPYFVGGREGLFGRAVLSASKRAFRTKTGMWGKCPTAKLDPAVGAATGPA